MNVRLTRASSRVRVEFARRPWIRWLAVAALALGSATLIARQSSRVDEARAAWSETLLVPVARTDLAPGDRLDIEAVRLPRRAVPPSAALDATTGSTVRRHVSVGEIIVDADLAHGRGPAGAADPDTLVVPVSDPLVRSAPVGVVVSIFAEGVQLTSGATVVQVEDHVLFVAVDSDDVALVTSAARQDIASIVFVP